jgi:hypothetical protein
MPRRQKFKQGTWLDPEEYAYPSGKLRDSRRRFRAMMNAGVTGQDYVEGVAGIPDTYFTIPAKGTFHGEPVEGYIHVGGHLGTGEGVLIFDVQEGRGDDDEDEYEDNAGAKLRRPVHNYFSAQTAYHDLHRGRGRGKLANNTYLVRGENNSYCVRLHSTNIVCFYPDGAIELNSGGHQTVTTKARMNEVLPPGWGVSQKNFEWTVHTPGGNHEFFDRMVIQPDGTMGIVNPPREHQPHPGYKGHVGELPEDYFAYRGYLVRKRLAEQYWDISKDGFHIGGAPSPEAARGVIAQLT